MAQLHQVFRCSTNQAVTDRKGDLEIDPSPDCKPVELVADGSWYVAELGDVQNQPSGRVQHGLEPVEKIGVRPEQETVAVIDPTRNQRRGLVWVAISLVSDRRTVRNRRRWK